MLSTLAPNNPIRRLLPWIVAVSLFMETLDMTILNTAVPTIANSLKVGVLSMKAVLSSYTLSLALFIPISGWMADHFGTRRVFGSAIGMFTLGSLLCGLSTDIHVLVACRILQGFGGAMMMPVGRLTMIRSFPKSELIRAMSFVAIPGLIGPMLGPVVGGLIVAYFHWSIIFFVNIPIGLLGLYLVNRYLPDYREESPTPPDIGGLFLFGSGISILSYVLEVFGENGQGTTNIFILLGVSALLLIWYYLRATRTPFPLLRLGLFKLRTFRTSVIGGFVTRIGIGGMPFLVPLLYQVGMGFSPIISGMFLAPQALGAMSLKTIVMELLSRFGYRRILIWNTLILGLLIMLFAIIGPGTPIGCILCLAFFYGLFSSMQYTSMNTLVYSDVDEHSASHASTIFSTFQQLSMSFGVACASLIAAFFITPVMRNSAPMMIRGLHETFFVLGILTMISGVSFARLDKHDGEAISLHKETA